MTARSVVRASCSASYHPASAPAALLHSSRPVWCGRPAPPPTATAISLGRFALVPVGIVETLALLGLASQVRLLHLLHTRGPSRPLIRVREPAAHPGGLIVGFLREALRLPAARIRLELLDRRGEPGVACGQRTQLGEQLLHAAPVARLRRLAAFLLECRSPQLRHPLRNQLVGGHCRERR